MRYGVTLFPTDLSIGVVELARACEDRGLDSLWLPEHTHIPTSRTTPWPVAPDQPIDEKYKRSLDPLVALTAAATATTTLRLGTGILLVAQRDPIVTAKAIASVDHLAGGRLSIGIGFGWNEDEMNHHGVDVRAPPRRRPRARPRHAPAVGGRRGRVPRRVRRLLAELVMAQAGAAPAAGARRRTQPGRSCSRTSPSTPTGWIPIGGAGMRDALPRLREAVAEAGRDPSTLEITPMAVLPDPGKLDHYENLGVTEVVFDLPSAPADTVLPILDRYAELVTGRS